MKPRLQTNFVFRVERREVIKALTIGFGVEPSSAATSATRARMEEEMRGLFLRARETVTLDTRQRFAIVSSVVGMD